MSDVTLGKGAFMSFMKGEQEGLFQLPRDQLWLKWETTLESTEGCVKPGWYDFNDDGPGVSPRKHAGAKTSSLWVLIKKPWPGKAGQRQAGASLGHIEALSKQ